MTYKAHLAGPAERRVLQLGFHHVLLQALDRDLGLHERYMKKRSKAFLLYRG